jgi:uncharacterized protein (DUF362 family)
MKSYDNNFLDRRVAIYHDPNLGYPLNPPYSPSKFYPEYKLKHFLDNENLVYDRIRQTLLLLGMDSENYGTPFWNPFKLIIKPGDKVVIKPNFVLDRHDNGGDLYSIITHPAIIRTVIDYVFIALEGKGRIIIADAPQMDCNFDNLLIKTGLLSIRKLYKEEFGFNIEIYDLRQFWFDAIKAKGSRAAYTKFRYNLPGDPEGEVLVSLGKKSLFYGINSKNFYGADYDRREIIRYHHDEIHDYLISKTILSADTIIMLPKLKVHKKVGVTLNIKGFVGTVVNKNCLIHYRLGTPSRGGDQFPENILLKQEEIATKLQRLASDVLLSRRNKTTDAIYDSLIKIALPIFKSLGLLTRRKIRILDDGNWFGNDSAWRMAIDLYRIFLYADKNGNMCDKLQERKMFSIIDGIIGGEGNGPLVPNSKKGGIIIAGFDPGAVDIVGTRIMGFDYNKLKKLSYILSNPKLFGVSKEDITILSNQNDYFDLLNDGNSKRYLGFEPHPGWKGYIEI